MKTAVDSPLRGRPLWNRWFVTVTLGEFLGFAVPALVGAATANASPLVAAVAILVAGAVEGAALGTAQAAVLRRALPGLRSDEWIIATTVGAVIAYAIGMSPSTAAGLGLDLPLEVLILAGPVLGVALLLTIGTAQWTVLRREVPRSTGWIAVTALAWAVGLGVFLAFAMPLWHPGQAPALVVAIGVGGGLLMAATTSASTGLGMRRLVRKGSV
jgi:hypothetical protein